MSSLGDYRKREESVTMSTEVGRVWARRTSC